MKHVQRVSAFGSEWDPNKVQWGLNWMISGRPGSVLDSVWKDVRSRFPLRICLGTVDSTCGGIMMRNIHQIGNSRFISMPLLNRETSPKNCEHRLCPFGSVDA